MRFCRWLHNVLNYEERGEKNYLACAHNPYRAYILTHVHTQFESRTADHTTPQGPRSKLHDNHGVVKAGEQQRHIFLEIKPTLSRANISSKPGGFDAQANTLKTAECGGEDACQDLQRLLLDMSLPPTVSRRSAQSSFKRRMELRGLQTLRRTGDGLAVIFSGWPSGELRFDVRRGALAVLPRGLWEPELRAMYQEKREREARETYTPYT
ncbi:hypothetical protein EYF80_009497 [Liparis tanakae]|uniref:Uncharacterized protein n=1 Tax=Liparis tanakae TaxID=230148 RepID=A0A4Z2ISB4_9TELE|nr:hypothetical protein EYF80_009497 [Liparis tanakae]